MHSRDTLVNDFTQFQSQETPRLPPQRGPSDKCSSIQSVNNELAPEEQSIEVPALKPHSKVYDIA